MVDMDAARTSTPLPSLAAKTGQAWLGWALPLLLASLAAGQVAELAPDLRLSASLHLTALLLTVAAVACCKLGVWRIAAQHGRRPGRSAQAWMVRLALLAGAVLLGWTFAVQHRPAQALEMGRIALGQDPVPIIDAQPTPDGRSLLLRGSLGGGSAARVKAALAETPAVQWVRLDSAGGRLLEAEAIAAEVKRLGLDTHVEGQCASACTLVLLAGRTRTAVPEAQIGFHRPQFAGVDAQELGDTPVLLGAYRSAGLGESFIERVRRTPSDRVWYPGRAELLVNGVLGGAR